MPKTLTELIDSREPAWPQVSAWIAQAKTPVQVLEASPRRAADVLLNLQVTTRSPMGAIAFQTGGLLIDHGWLRVLGGGCGRMEGDLARWNGLGRAPLIEAVPGALFIAHDVLGGFFALDGGALGEGKGIAHYLAPDTLEWESTGKGYSELIAWMLMGDLQRFYGDHRWEGWQEEVQALSPDRGFSFYPPLFAKEEPGLVRSRKDVPMAELLALNLDFAAQLTAQ
ncbi:MAG: DUF2625 family protein [Deltaproteobacteria bacterium]|nr:DUF2625 family protein [Deltaproteobacteria bacterium]